MPEGRRRGAHCPPPSALGRISNRRPRQLLRAVDQRERRIAQRTRGDRNFRAAHHRDAHVPPRERRERARQAPHRRIDLPRLDGRDARGDIALRGHGRHHGLEAARTQRRLVEARHQRAARGEHRDAPHAGRHRGHRCIDDMQDRRRAALAQRRIPVMRGIARDRDHVDTAAVQQRDAVEQRRQRIGSAVEDRARAIGRPRQVRDDHRQVLLVAARARQANHAMHEVDRGQRPHSAQYADKRHDVSFTRAAAARRSRIRRPSCRSPATACAISRRADRPPRTARTRPRTAGAAPRRPSR